MPTGIVTNVAEFRLVAHLNAPYNAVTPTVDDYLPSDVAVTVRIGVRATAVIVPATEHRPHEAFLARESPKDQG